jgi:hypothetical protein
VPAPAPAPSVETNSNNEHWAKAPQLCGNATPRNLQIFKSSNLQIFKCDSPKQTKTPTSIAC